MRDDHERSLAWLEGRIAAGESFRGLAEAAVAHLRSRYDSYDWVGIYMLDGEGLRLWAWDGPAATEHVHIPLDRGVCGYAAATGQTINVPDVQADERYLQCFLGTRAELVVPITAGERVYGEVDIDSDRPAAFGDGDEAFLAAFCERLGALAERETLPAREPR
ncbi:MAG: GAF domain-containing protein [Deinococcales bacterium]